MNLISGKYVKTAAVIWSISLIILVPAYLFVLRPQKSELAGLDSSLEEMKNKANLARITAAESTRERLREQIELMKAQLGDFVLASRDDIQSLAFVELLNISREIGLEAFNIDPWSSSEISAFSACKYIFGQPMQVNFNANFNEFAAFLNTLERHKSVIFIDTFEITRASEENSRHNVEMSLAVLVNKSENET